MEWQWHQLDHMQIIWTSLQTNNHSSTSSLNFFTGRMLFLAPNQQCQSTEIKVFRKITRAVLLASIKSRVQDQGQPPHNQSSTSTSTRLQAPDEYERCIPCQNVLLCLVHNIDHFCFRSLLPHKCSLHIRNTSISSKVSFTRERWRLIISWLSHLVLKSPKYRDIIRQR